MPAYDETAMSALRPILCAVRALLSEASRGVLDSRSSSDLLPAMLSGKRQAGAAPGGSVGLCGPYFNTLLRPCEDPMQPSSSSPHESCRQAVYRKEQQGMQARFSALRGTIMGPSRVVSKTGWWHLELRRKISLRLHIAQMSFWLLVRKILSQCSWSHKLVCLLECEAQTKSARRCAIFQEALHNLLRERR